MISIKQCQRQLIIVPYYLFFKGNVNSCTGTLPSELFVMDKMNYFQIQNSGRIGTVPVEYTTWPDVEVMLLNGNSLTGTIHTELGNADFIRYIFLGDNDLSGTIPSELGRLTRLEGKFISFCLELQERNSDDNCRSIIKRIFALNYCCSYIMVSI